MVKWITKDSLRRRGRLERIIAFVLLLAILIPPFPGGAPGEQILSAEVAAAAGPTSEAEYRLGPGDVLQVRVWGQDDLTTVVEVRPDGAITLQFVGDISVGGRTVAQLSADLTQAYAQYLKAARVTINVQQFRTLQVQVLGEVNVPGFYRVRPDAKVLDVLAMAGGPKDGADLSHATLTHTDRQQKDGSAEVVPVDIDAILSAGDFRYNLALRDGDALYVPQAQKVVVLGAVRVPGSYVPRKGSRVLDLVAAAGGTLENADLAGAVLSRLPNSQPSAAILSATTAAGEPAANPGDQTVGQREEYLIDLQRLMANHNSSDNLAVKPGDILFVPEAREAVILGAVARPGSYRIKADTRLLDLLAMAGGALPSARLEGVVVTHSGAGASGVAITRPTTTSSISAEESSVTVNLAQALKQDGHAENLFVQAGDVLFVPEANRRVLVLGQVRSPGAYPVQADGRLLDAVAMAGGVTDRASLDAVTLTREVNGAVQVMPIDLDRVLTNRNAQQNMELQGGDVILIPEAKSEFVVLGEVANPGTFPFRRGLRVLDAIGLAGGLKRTAAGAQVTLTRDGGGSGKQVLRIDVDALMENRSDTQNMELIAGDVLFVPEAKQQVLVLGEVERPGYYIVQKESRLLDAIAMAGGPKESAALDRVALTRAESDTRHVDLAAVLENRSPEQNVRLAGGDVIVIPEARRNILVLGEVRNPGSYLLPKGARALDALALAGGSKDGAALKQTTLVRQSTDAAAGTTGSSEVTTVDLEAILRSDPAAPNPYLQGGDTLIVPAGRQEMAVLGQVRSPGYYAVRPGLRLLDALALAGGPLDAAALEKVALSRQSAEGPVERLVDVEALLSGANPQENVLMQPGDLLFVPEGQRQVAILGEVNRPGYYTVKPGTRLADVVAMAGGPTDRADLAGATLGRMSQIGQTVQSIDLQSVLQNRDPTKNVPVFGGDVLIVPLVNRQVVVLGQVRTPGAYVLQPGERLLDLLARAGGAGPAADTDAALLTRTTPEGRRQIAVNLTALLAAGGGDANIPLQAGDVLFLPEANRQVVVLGDVGRPGSYSVKPGDTVLDVLAAAGGPRETADLKSASLTSRSSVDATSGRTLADDQATVVDLQALLANPKNAHAYPVRGGDTLFVPQGRRQVLVLGEVNRPGSYTIRAGDRVLDAIAAAGGTKETADLEAASLRRSMGGSETQWRLDLSGMMREKGGSGNEVLQGDDVIFVPEARRQVLVLGEVNRPGAYAMRPGARLLDLVGLAGGPTDRADLGNTVLTRSATAASPDTAIAAAGGDQVWSVDLAEVLSTPQSGENRLLKGGDVLYVPEAKRQILVLGQVKNPGVYTIKPGVPVTLLEAIAMAGGPQERAATQSVGIYRGGNLTGGSTVAVGKDGILFQGDLQENPTLQGGDIVYVPETSKPDWTKIFSFLSGIRVFKDLFGF